MKNLLRNVAPILLVGGLLVANLLPLGGEKKPPKTEAKSPPTLETKKRPTPQLDPLLASYPDLPGRLFFFEGNTVAILERGQLTRIPLPDKYLIPAPVADAFSLDGRRLALFGYVGTQLFLQISDLRSGESPNRLFPVREQFHAIRWSPDGMELLAWSSQTVSLRLLDGTPRELLFPEGVTSAVWSPDGGQVAIETSSGPLILFDRRTGEETALEGQITDPVWGKRGLLYLRPSAPSLAFLRTPAGEESVTNLPDSEPWVQAKVVDLSFRDESPGLVSGPGRPPAQIKLLSLKSGAQRDSLFFTFQVDDPATRYGVGQAIDGEIQLWLYPVSGDRLCRPAYVQASLGGLFVLGEGANCLGLLIRVRHGEDRVREIRSSERPLIDTTGSWTLTREGGQVVVTNLDQPMSYTFSAPGTPLHWDGRQ